MKTKAQLKKSLGHWEKVLAKMAADQIVHNAHMEEVQILVQALRYEIRHAKA